MRRRRAAATVGALVVLGSAVALSASAPAPGPAAVAQDTGRCAAAPAPAAASGTPSGTSSGADSLPAKAPAGWRRVFTDDFTTDASQGSFPGSAYRARWTGYEGLRDTSRNGLFSESRVVTVHDGVLDMHLRTKAGQPLVAAPVPLATGAWGGQRCGRYTVRFRADPVPGYKLAWLLWPDSEEWADGEVDFPEGPLDGTISGFNHCPGDPEQLCGQADSDATFDTWHTATTEWTADGVSFVLDGAVVGTSTTSPAGPMHWVLQTETVTSGAAPSASAQGHVEVDWVTIDVQR